MKTIHAALVAHLALPVTTWNLLSKVECVGAFAGEVYGFTNLDQDVSYNDGSGLLIYESDNGFTPRRMAKSTAFRVDDSEMDGVLASSGITLAKVRAGLFDGAKFTVYRVNRNDLTSGRHEVVDYGRLGATVFDDQLNWRTERRSLWQLTKQPINEPYSRTCNAQFGDARCQKPFTWHTFTVTAVDPTDARRVFSNDLAQANGYFSDHGGVVVEWLTGDNAQNQMEVDVYTVGEVELALDMPFPVQVGDTGRARQDCDKLFSTCRDVHANTDNGRGQNLIPVDGSAMVPGAEIRRA